MKALKTLARVPEDDHVRKLLKACADTFEGRRNRALIALLADSGLRISGRFTFALPAHPQAQSALSVRKNQGETPALKKSGPSKSAIWKVDALTR